MTRWLSIAFGLALVAVAFIAASRVADTREGLIAEVVTLFSGLAGVVLLLYGLVPKRPSAPAKRMPTSEHRDDKRTRTANDLILGAGGLLLAAVLLTGLAISGGWIWAGLGAVLLLPMIIGSGYLFVAFVRAPERDWRIDVRRLSGLR